MISFILRALVFDFVYSFVVGLALMILLLPFIILSKSEQPGVMSSAISLVGGIALCAIQGVMIAAAVTVALQLDPSRWGPVWYFLGFGFSVPIAVTRSLGDPEQSRFAGLSIISSSVAYVLACFAPQLIPPILGDTAVRLLL